MNGVLRATIPAVLLVALALPASAQESGQSTQHEHYGDPSEGHFGDPSAGHFGSPPQQRWSEYEPVTVRPLKPFDDRYAAAIAAKQQQAAARED